MAAPSPVRLSLSRALSPNIRLLYQPLLTRRYLFSKVMPLLAALAVALCTAMVLVVWSVMGGFLSTLLEQGRAMIGDVSIEYPVEYQFRGIPYADDLVQRLQARDEVAAASPTVETLGMLALPFGVRKAVQVVGIDPITYDRVTDYRQRLWWQRPQADEAVDPGDPRLDLPPGFEDAGLYLSEDGVPGGEPAATLGISVSPFNQRASSGEGGYFRRHPTHFMPGLEVTLTVAPLSQSGVPIEPVDRLFPVVNETYSGMYDADAQWVFVPIATLQRMLKIDEARRLDPTFVPGTLVADPDTGEFVPAEPPVVGVEPARVTNVLVRAKDGVSDQELLDVCKAVYAEFAATHREAPSAALMQELELIYTWERKPGLRTFVAAVKKETALVLVLFGFISMTAVFLVFAIFWAMISEKTKDVGILRAVGASRTGVAWLFLRYGAAIGVVGAVVGGAIAALIVANINAIHEWIGTTLGLYVWDPSVYYFFEIPADVDAGKFAIVMTSGVVASVLGALVPAVRAAAMDPVKAIRFE